MTLAWNVVAKRMHPHEQLQGKLREKISKLERHLQHFPPDAVHLQISLARDVKKNRFTAALTLRVPSNVLHSSKSAPDPITAFDQGVKALLRELMSLKSALRREAAWKRAARLSGRTTGGSARFAAEPLPAGEGPQNLGDAVRGAVGELYPQLLEHIRRQMSRAQLERGLPVRSIDPEAVADETARQAMARPELKPADRSYRLWLYALARHELARRIRDLQDRARSSVCLDAAPERPHLASDDEGYANGEPISLFERPERRVEPEGTDLADAHNLPPDLAASETDLLDHLQRLAQGWSPAERSAFELHFLEGFETDEVAMLEGLKLPQAHRLIDQVQARLREAVVEAMQARARQQPARRLARDWTAPLTRRK